MQLNKNALKICDECKSEFYKDSSLMENLCPECANLLYGYKNCEHQFENKRCSKCYWDGNSSDFLNKRKKINYL